MDRFVIKLAEQVIAVNCLFASTKVFCKDYLVTEAPSWEVTIHSQDIEEEQRRSDRQQIQEGREPLVYPPEYLETLALYRKVLGLLIEKDTFLFHGSCLAVDGEAYLFTGPSGTGKSTHRRLWQEYFGSKVQVINDDKPLLRIVGGQVYVYGTPWMGKHEMGTNISAKLAGICLLKQGQTNDIRELSSSESYSFLFQQTQRLSSSQQTKHLLELLSSLQTIIPCYELSCTISEEAVKLAYKTMKERSYETTS